MFTSTKKYNQLWADYLELAASYRHLLGEWNRLAETINAKGGQAFLEGKVTGLTEDDIRTLISLCHPDKHSGRAAAVEMTQKLLALRDRAEKIND